MASDIAVSLVWKFSSTGSNRYVDVHTGIENRILKLYVGRLPYQTTDQDLADLFGRFGQVLSATVIVDRETGRSKGFGFVELSDDQASRNAIDQLNGSDLEGRTIIVNEANPRPESRNRDRRSYGGNSGGYRDRRY